MDRALSETDRRRAAQLAFNEEHGITPRTIVKGVSDIAELLGIGSHVPYKERRSKHEEGMSSEELERLMASLEEEMFAAAEELRFEYAAKLRDEIKDLARELVRLRGSASIGGLGAVGAGAGGLGTGVAGAGAGVAGEGTGVVGPGAGGTADSKPSGGRGGPVPRKRRGARR